MDKLFTPKDLNPLKAATNTPQELAYISSEGGITYEITLYK